MKIKVTPKNAEKIEAALHAVNGNAKSQTLTSYDEVAWICQEAGKRVPLPVKYQSGISCRYVPAGPAKSYKYSTKSTKVTVERGAKDWYLIAVVGVTIFPHAAELSVITITKGQADEIARRAVAGFHVAE